MEYGKINAGKVTSQDMIYQKISFGRKHSDLPKAILVTYESYRFFNGKLYLDYDAISNDGFYFCYIPDSIGNGTGALVVDWIAIW